MSNKVSKQPTSVDNVNRVVDDLNVGNATTATERMSNFDTAHPKLGCQGSTFETPLLKAYEIDAAFGRVGVASFNTAGAQPAKPTISIAISC